jgi:hypothetical protein
VTVYMLGLLQHVWCVFMTKCVLCSEISICCRNWVSCSELVFAVELCIVQRNSDSLPKLSLLQRISIRCRVVYCAAKLWFAAETVSAATN